MSTIDKVIKQCFKDTANSFMMIIFSGFFTSLLLAFGFTALIAPIALIIMIVGVYKVIAYLFYKSIYAEEATMYQMLPVSAEEIIISRVFVGMVAWILFYLTFAESIALGIAFLDSDVGIMGVIEEFCELVYTIGVAAFVSFIAIFLTSIFLEIVLIFAGVTYFNTNNGAKQKGVQRFAIILGTWGLVRVSEMLYSAVLQLAIVGNMMTFCIATIGLVVGSIIIGSLLCKQIKKRLEHNLQL